MGDWDTFAAGLYGLLKDKVCGEEEPKFDELQIELVGYLEQLGSQGRLPNWLPCWFGACKLLRAARLAHAILQQPGGASGASVNRVGDATGASSGVVVGCLQDLRKVRKAIRDTKAVAREEVKKIMKALDLTDVAQDILLASRMLARPHPEKAGAIPFATYAIGEATSGAIRFFELELFRRESTDGWLAHHPADWPLVQPDQGMWQGHKDAWEVARAVVGEKANHLDGVWRAVKVDAPPLERRKPLLEPQGRSGTGAACYGWMQLFQSARSGYQEEPELLEPVLVIMDVKLEAATWRPATVDSDMLCSKVNALPAHNSGRNVFEKIMTVVVSAGQAGGVPEGMVKEGYELVRLA